MPELRVCFNDADRCTSILYTRAEPDDLYDPPSEPQSVDRYDVDAEDYALDEFDIYGLDQMDEDDD